MVAERVCVCMCVKSDKVWRECETWSSTNVGRLVGERSDGSCRLSVAYGQRGHVISTGNWIITHTCGRQVSNEQCGNVAPSSRGARPTPRPGHGRGAAADTVRAINGWPPSPVRTRVSPIRDQPYPCDDGVCVVTPHHTALRITSERRSTPGNGDPQKHPTETLTQ